MDERPDTYKMLHRLHSFQQVLALTFTIDQKQQTSFARCIGLTLRSVSRSADCDNLQHSCLEHTNDYYLL